MISNTDDESNNDESDDESNNNDKSSNNESNNEKKFKPFKAKEFLKKVKNILNEKKSLNPKEFDKIFNNQIVPILNIHFAFVENEVFFTYTSDPLEIPQIIKENDLHLLLASSKIEVKINNKKKTIKTSKAWIESPNKTVYKKTVFDPSNKNPNYFNLFRGWKWKKFNSIEDVNFDKIFPIIDHIEKVWANNNKESIQFIIQYLADIFQNPSRKNPTVLVIYGEQGTGKSIISQIVMGTLLGNYHGVCNNLDEFCGKFNSRLCKKLLIVLEEVSRASGYEFSNLLKSLITNPKKRMEKKGFDAIDINDYSRHIIETNNEFAIKVEKSDRRFACFEVINNYENKNERFQEIIKIIEDEECMTHLFNYFLFTPININFNDPNFIPKTEYKKKLQMENQIPEVRWILDRTELVEEKNKDPMLFQEDTECYKFQCGFGSYNDMGNMSTELGYVWKFSEELWIPSEYLYKVSNFFYFNHYHN